MGTPTDGYRFFNLLSPIAGNININDAVKPGLFPNLIDSSVVYNGPSSSGYYYLFNFVRGNTGALQQFALPYATSATSPGRMFFRGINGSIISNWAEIYTTVNTTKASDGTLKAASPVARIVKSREETERADVGEDGFSWCGCGTANAEAEGITISRLDVGVYVLTGSAGLASEGWQLLPPMDPGGMGELGVVEAEQTSNGELTIRLFKRKYMLGDDGEIIKTKGELMDVPANSWIDVRLDMPSDSLFNQRMSPESEV
ncbi:pyocin knob domain-containing protein [Enterobacter cloacae]|uniref:pyocin knob domain-containing protein n=1 Tax=Enterobacter cloacae TaxID=550 RepID=UPI00216AC3BC|nr:pyocin knob domain-containing protein [Enterobacter cloacae]